MLTTTHAAQAADESYVGVQASGLELEHDQGFNSLEPSALVGRVGGSVSDFLVFEGRIGTGLSDDSLRSGGRTITADLNYLVGGYGLFRGNVSGTLFPYAIAGGSLLDFDSTGNNDSDGTETSLSYGAGFDVRVTPAFKVGIEYIRYVDTADYDLDALSVGITSRF